MGISIAPVLKAYLPYGADRLSELAALSGTGKEWESAESNALSFIGAVEELLCELGVSSDGIAFNCEDLDEIVRRAQEEAKIVGYPRPFSDSELKEIILSVFN